MYPFTASVPLPWSRTVIWILTFNVCNAIRWRNGQYVMASWVNGATLLIVGFISIVFSMIWSLNPEWIPRSNLDSPIYPEINSVHIFCVFVITLSWSVSFLLLRWYFKELADVFNQLVALWMR